MRRLTRRSLRVLVLVAGVLAATSACSVDLPAAAEPDAGAGPGPDRPGETCEDTQSDPDNCGACGRTCAIANATAGCEAGECVIASCAAGKADADGMIDNGCEAGAQCGAATVAIHRSYAQGHVYSADLTFAQTSPNSLEYAGYFALQAEAGPGLVMVYRCSLGGVKSFITPDPGCEGPYTRVEDLGYMATASVCGAIPVYRMYNGTTGDHLFVVTTEERDGAISEFGYELVGTWGYVWDAP